MTCDGKKMNHANPCARIRSICSYFREHCAYWQINRRAIYEGIKMILVYQGASLLFRTIGRVCIIFLLLFVAAKAAANLDNLEQYPAIHTVVQAAISLEDGVLPSIRSVIPTQVRGHDLAIWVFAFMIIVCWRIAADIGERLNNKAYVLTCQRNIEKLRKEIGNISDISNLQQMDQALQLLKEGKSIDREKLLQIYSATRKQLDQYSHNGAFVSIDIVNSTGIKQGEVAEIAERDFVEYKKMVTKIINAKQAVKSTWTPDGAMIFFQDIRQGIGAAQDVLRSLGPFNANVKTVKMDFAVRIGINGGEVSFSDATPLEEISSRVIDIAGHMQKHARVNTIWINYDLIAATDLTQQFNLIEAMVDGCRVGEWAMAV